MRLVGVQGYISALKQLARVCSLRPPLSIFLTTEDARALQEMRHALSLDEVRQAVARSLTQPLPACLN